MRARGFCINGGITVFETRFVSASKNPPSPAGHPPLARGTFNHNILDRRRPKHLPPLLKGGAAAAAVGLNTKPLALHRTLHLLHLLLLNIVRYSSPAYPLEDVGCHAILGATDPSRIRRRRRFSCSISILGSFLHEIIRDQFFSGAAGEFRLGGQQQHC